MTSDVILTLSILLSAALVARLVASLLRVPEILVLVVFGAVLGPSVLDVIDVPFDSIGAQLMFTLGVSLILFYGGLNLSVGVLRRVWVGLGMLVVPGVILTAAIVGVAAHLAFDLPWYAALLMGAVLAPTDPAILIPLFIRSRLRPKVAQTVVAESAFNDPTGSGAGAGTRRAAAERRRLARGAGRGVRRRPRDQHRARGRRGVLLAAVISSHRAGIWRESSAAAVLAVVTIGYFSLDSAGGSGYLGCVPRRPDRRQHGAPRARDALEHEQEMRQFAFNLADLVTFFVFLVLGANIPFDELGENLLPALAVLAALLLAGPPAYRARCVLPDRRGAWTRNEVAFLCWTRETGVVPAALVGVLAGLGVPNIDAYASVVALAIILTLILQALPAAWLAGRLGLLDGEAPAPASPAPGTVT